MNIVGAPLIHNLWSDSFFSRKLIFNESFVRSFVRLFLSNYAYMALHEYKKVSDGGVTSVFFMNTSEKGPTERGPTLTQ